MHLKNVAKLRLETKTYVSILPNVTALALGLRPRKRLARLRAKREAWGSHLLLPGMQKNER